MFPRLLLTAALITIAAPAPAVAQTADPREQVVVPPPSTQIPAWLGVTLAQREGEPGIRVSNVLRRSPADRTDIRAGDIIYRVASRRVETVAELRAVIRAFAPGDKIRVDARRGDEELSFEFQLEALPDAETIARNHLLGRPAPELYFRFVGDGKDVHLTELKGKPTVIDFWATWCRPCRRVQDDLAAVKDVFGDAINIVGVSEEEAKTVRAYLGRHPARYAMAVDVLGNASRDFAINTIPAVVILDAEHTVAAIVFGAGKRQLIQKKLENLVSVPVGPTQESSETE